MDTVQRELPQNEEFKEDEPAGLKFAHLTLRTFLILLVTQLFSLAVSIITARALGPAGKGIITVLILYPTLLFTLSHLSIYRAITVQIAEKRYPFEYFPATALAYIIFVSAIMILFFIFSYFKWNRFFIPGVNFPLILLSLALLPLLFVNQVFSSILEVSGKVSLINFKEIFYSIVLSISIVISLIVFKKYISGAVFSYFITNLLVSALLIYFVKKISLNTWEYSFPLVRDMIKEGAKLHIAVIASFISLKIDMLMLGFYRQSESVGYYSVAVSITELLMLISIAIQTIFYSRLTEMVKDKTEMAKKTVMIYKHSFLTFGIFSVIIILFSKPVVILFYGHKFLPSLPPLWVLMPGAFFLYVNSILVNYLVGMKKIIGISIAFSICSFLNVFLNTILIPRYDSIGAALASSITYSLQSIFIILFFFYISKYGMRDFLKEMRFKKEDLRIYKALLWNKKGSIFMRRIP